MDDAPNPIKLQLTENLSPMDSTSLVIKYFRVVLILLHICLMLEAAFLLMLGHNMEIGANATILRMFVRIFLPTAPDISLELLVGVLVVGYPIVLAIGVMLMAYFFFGMIVSCFGNVNALKIYGILLGIFVCALITATAVLFGSPTYEGGTYCCGLLGYKDFAGSLRMPATCCSVDNKVVAKSCDYSTAAAMNPLLPGCMNKISYFVELSRPQLAVVPVSFLTPPV
ncbi:unnamed protein product [Schistocephalus solidus]|uniref:Tetraspanin family n=1 Tax=Schistocephalus solidus TaxID=70667 RepID=A0A183S9W8_SCHSO|nr:unnamed protein product [Schistocephalus solidus]